MIYIRKYRKCAVFLPYVQHRKYHIKTPEEILPTCICHPALHLPGLGPSAWNLLTQQLAPSSVLRSWCSFVPGIRNLAYNGFRYPADLFCLPNEMANSKQRPGLCISVSPSVARCTGRPGFEDNALPLRDSPSPSSEIAWLIIIVWLNHYFLCSENRKDVIPGKWAWGL